MIRGACRGHCPHETTEQTTRGRRQGPGRRRWAMTLSRRDFIKAGAAGALVVGGLAVPLRSSVSAGTASTLADRHMPRPFATPFAAGPQLRGRLVRGPLQDGTTGLYR